MKSASRSQETLLREPLTYVSKMHVPPHRRRYYAASKVKYLGSIIWKGTDKKLRNCNQRNSGEALMKSTGYLHVFLGVGTQLLEVTGIGVALC